MSDDFKYYMAYRQNDDSIPLLIQDADCPGYLYQNVPIEKPTLMRFSLRDPIPRKPKMADYLISPNSVVSKKIFDVLKRISIDGIQLLEAIITGKNEEIFTEYWAVHIYRVIKCIDTNLSDCSIGKVNISDVETIVLDKELLKAVPLENRLVFRLEEDLAYKLFHSSIVEKVMAVAPTGIKFTDIEKWHDGSFFDN